MRRQTTIQVFSDCSHGHTGGDNYILIPNNIYIHILGILGFRLVLASSVTRRRLSAKGVVANSHPTWSNV